MRFSPASRPEPERAVRVSFFRDLTNIIREENVSFFILAGNGRLHAISIRQ